MPRLLEHRLCRAERPVFAERYDRDDTLVAAMVEVLHENVHAIFV